MEIHKLQPVHSFQNLRARVDRLFKVPTKRTNRTSQLSLDLLGTPAPEIRHPNKNITEFLTFLSDALPDGEVYLFGGVLRDIALLGRKGFNSDIDLVVDGGWNRCVTYLESLNAQRNKFGGYRLQVGEWPIDIWNARETWAVKQGLVPYKSIASLLETTVLNWDAILMNLRTRTFVCHDSYLETMKSRFLDIVLEENPNPLGMAVRVFRHLCSKDARTISPSAATYLARCTSIYSFDEIKDSEIRSYGNSIIDPRVYRFFAHLKDYKDPELQTRFRLASDALKKELGLSLLDKTDHGGVGISGMEISTRPGPHSSRDRRGLV